ncbi:hypothetical protein CGW93_02590 [candidate division bacterium WOR-3 4484_18]|uniref:FlgD Ig-like domain-containing protein n=1 Tax=candidate division WOR-3 bacterium 4484_18 TaxID=2020626 RepID=A0A257LVU1_UNCW3|nr:MAG: hypothetical protein CGW93_02590 [candidate division bacterium WOR-3 4484_18]
MHILRQLDFDLAYLAMLTKERIKPMSRWEKPVDKKKHQILKRYGLHTAIVTRKLMNGTPVYETIFSTKQQYIDYYMRRFDNKPVANSKDDSIIEGLLFGYPYCCVENFVTNGYTPNPYIGKEQRILFHWVCPNCKVTPTLIPYYKRIYRECKALFTEHPITRRNKLTAVKMLPAMIFSLLATGMGKLNGDPHWLPVNGDDDGDYLTHSEEILLGTEEFWLYPSAADSIAKRYAAIINSLPRETPDSVCYAIDNPTYGFYNCPVCGELINMGFVTVYNTKRGMQIDIPYMGLHFMEHGSFSYIIEGDTARVDVQKLKEILSPFDTNHLVVPTSDDIDNDGLNSASEEYFGTDVNNPYTHDIGVDDGYEFTERIIERIATVEVVDYNDTPTESIYMWYEPTDGLEICYICGEQVNMGMVEIINTEINDTVRFPIIGLHFMAHGRFTYHGTTNTGEIDPIHLSVVLDMQLSVDEVSKLAHRYGYELLNFVDNHTSARIVFDNVSDCGTPTVYIYNVGGELVKHILPQVDGTKIVIEWNGTNERGQPLPTGIYFIKLHTDSGCWTKKCLLIR